MPYEAVILWQNNGGHIVETGEMGMSKWNIDGKLFLLPKMATGLSISLPPF